MLRIQISTRKQKAIIDVLLIAGLTVSILSANHAEHSWFSLHCIISLLWYVLMLIHIGQHWPMTQALLKLKWKALKRNKITFLTMIAFIAMTFGIILFVVEISERFVHIHHTIADIFKVVVILHAVVKTKQFVACFR